MDDDVDAKLINMMGFIQLFNGNRPDYNPDDDLGDSGVEEVSES